MFELTDTKRDRLDANSLVFLWHLKHLLNYVTPLVVTYICCGLRQMDRQSLYIGALFLIIMLAWNF